MDQGAGHNGAVLTVTIAQPDVLDRLADLTQAGRVRLVPWDVDGPLPHGVAAHDVDMVVMPASGVTPERLARLDDLTGLRLVQLPSAGYEHALAHAPVRAALSNGRGVHDAGTAELAVGLLLASFRGIDDAARAMPEGRWAPTLRRSVADRTVMVLGHGSIGSAVARRLAAFEVGLVRVARTSRVEDGQQVHGVEDLPSLLPGVDAVVTVLPLTDETTGLVGAAFLAALPDGAVVVNVGRGRVVDTDALLAEVGSGRLRAALDVTDPEPLPADHPLWRTPGVLITPHVGGWTDATGPRLSALVRRQVEALLSGAEPHNVVRAAHA